MKRRFEEDATRKPQVRPWERAVFVIYALWSLVAIVEIVGRHLTGSSPLPGIFADHNGNLAV